MAGRYERRLGRNNDNYGKRIIRKKKRGERNVVKKTHVYTARTNAAEERLSGFGGGGCVWAPRIFDIFTRRDGDDGATGLPA